MTLMLPNQLGVEDNTAVGIGYLKQEEKLFVIVSIDISRRKKKMRTEIDLTEEVEVKTPKTTDLSCSTEPEPWVITFSDGSCESYGAVFYL